MLLIVDDDQAVRTSLKVLLKRAGYECEAVSGPEAALEAVRRQAPQAVLLDMNFTNTTDGRQGIETLRKLRILVPDTPVILITGWGSIDLAVEGMKAGAFDFITKPWDNRRLVERVNMAVEIHSSTLRDDADRVSFDRCGIVGTDAALTRLLDTVARVSRSDVPVLITGESGTGKELIAEAIHRNSRRSSRPFVKVNLGGMHRELFESEMFGHTRGAFTGAATDRKGRFAAADGGTIFLDEIGDLDPASQVKMLRVLQEQKFEPLGTDRTVKVDVRVVSATNADLPAMMRSGRFREDLFYRINLVTLHVPALRERRGDILPLARHFATSFARANGMAEPDFDTSASRWLHDQHWPGNIRQLKNTVERTVLVTGADVITATHLAGNNDAPAATATLTATSTIEELERARVADALSRHEGNISRAAAELGVSRAALYRRISKYDL